MFYVMRFIILLLPLLLFFAWFIWRSHQEQRITTEQYTRYRRILIGLGGASVLLMMATGIATLLFSESSRDMGYIPPRMVDGKLVPSHLEPHDE